MAIVLHQFPISHYCEKVRWALDYKGVDYRLKNHLPGLHLKKMKAVAPFSSVPVLEHDGHHVQGSAAIISYLDKQFPVRSLTPQSQEAREEALRWESFCDDNIGPHVRRYCYHTLLDHPNLVIPFFAQGGPLWGKAFLRMIFPKLQGVMRKAMQIREPHVSDSRVVLEQSIQTLSQAYQGRTYLVGEQFSRADLAATSLLAPLFMPPAYGLDWPSSMPEPLQTWVNSQAGHLEPFRRLYDEKRSF